MGFLIAALILALLLSLRITVRIRAGDELRLQAGIGFVRLTLYPAKEKRLKLSDYRIDRYRRRLAKEQKPPKKPKKSDSKKSSKSTGAADEGEKRDIVGLIKQLSHVAEVFLRRFGRHLRIEVRELVLIVSADDAAATAILYGAVIGAVQNLYALLTSAGTLQTRRSTVIAVEPDFTAGKPSARIDLRFSLRLWQLIDIAIRALVAYSGEPPRAGTRI